MRKKKSQEMLDQYLDDKQFHHLDRFWSETYDKISSITRKAENLFFST